MSNAIPALGQMWEEQGGVRAAVMRGHGMPDYHLIIPVEAAATIIDTHWGEYGKRIKGADSDTDGFANTRAMAEADNELAKRILGLEIAGHADLYLPARHELRACYLNVPELFDADCWWWTSTQSSAYYAWGQYFDNGNQHTCGESIQGRARAVRRFSIQ